MRVKRRKLISKMDRCPKCSRRTNTICDNGCGTMYCDGCGISFFKEGKKVVVGHAVGCGEDSDSEEGEIIEN